MDDEYTTIKIPQSLVVKIDELREKEPQYRSRADVVEVAVRCFLQKAFFEYGWPKGGKKRILQRERNHSHNRYSKTLTVFIIATFLTLAVAAAIPVTQVSANGPTTWNVDDDRVQCPSADYIDIQDAISVAGAGDTVNVYPGSYNPFAIIEKNELTIKSTEGAASTTVSGDYIDIDGSWYFATIMIRDSADVTIDGFEVVGGGWWTSSDGIWITYGGTYPDYGGSPRAAIKNNVIHHKWHGISVSKSPDVAIENNEVYDTSGHGIYIASGSDGAVIKGNEVHDLSVSGGQGAVALFSKHCLVEGNILHDVTGWGGGMWMINPSDCVILGNDIYNNPIGIFYQGTGNRINFNNIYDNTASGSSVGNWGIYVNTGSVDAENNWWGDKSGPSGVGPGTGDAVSTNVDYDPWLRAPIAEGGVKSETVSGSGTVDARDEADTAVVIDAVGKHTITVSKYESNPGTGFAAGKGSIGKYIDVHLDDDTGVTQIEIRLYYTDAEVAGLVESSLKMYWWDGAAWVECSNTGVNTVLNYIWAIITATSTPNLAQLSGQGFGGGGNPAPAKPVGGEVFLVDKIALLAPYIVAILVVATGAAVIRRRRS